LTDTVGFVRHLPHDLIEAFASTLEESAESDLLLHIVDASDPDPIGQISAVRSVLAEIGAGDVAELIVLNKADVAPADQLVVLQGLHPDAVVVSARTGAGIETLRAAIVTRLPRLELEVRALIPYERGDLIDRIHRAGEFVTSEHTAEGTLVLVRVNPALAGELAPYEVAAAAQTR